MRKRARHLKFLKLMLLCFFSLQASSTLCQNSKADIVFEGNKVFSSQQLIDETNKCLAKYSKSGDQGDPEVFDYCLRTVKHFLIDQGYLRAAVGEPKKQETEHGLKITVPIEEGPLYRLGEIKIKGAKLFSPEHLLETLNMNTGDVASGEA